MTLRSFKKGQWAFSLAQFSPMLTVIFFPALARQCLTVGYFLQREERHNYHLLPYDCRNANFLMKKSVMHTFQMSKRSRIGTKEGYSTCSERKTNCRNRRKNNNNKRHRHLNNVIESQQSKSNHIVHVLMVAYIEIERVDLFWQYFIHNNLFFCSAEMDLLLNSFSIFFTPFIELLLSKSRLLLSSWSVSKGVTTRRGGQKRKYEIMQLPYKSQSVALIKCAKQTPIHVLVRHLTYKASNQLKDSGQKRPN